MNAITKVLFTAMLVTLCLADAHSQMNQTVTIEEVQVPVAVREALKRDFTETPAGAWSVNVLRTQEGGLVSTVPQWYVFSSKVNRSKVEVRYSPEGDLLKAKGISPVQKTN